MTILEKVAIPLEKRQSILSSSIDYYKVMELNDAEFAQLNFELMDSYRTQKNGWWSEGRIPSCQRCHSVVEGPENLARYHGMKLHHTPCFQEFWKEERKDQYRNNDFMRSYWDRVASLNPLRELIKPWSTAELSGI